MSGEPSWARTEPSTYSTRLWTTDCGMDDDVERLGAEREEVEGLDQLQPLVHQGGEIDRDLRAHRPIGMRDGLRRASRRASRSSGLSRNGPPLAVRMIRRTALRPGAGRSTGRSRYARNRPAAGVAPLRRGRLDHQMRRPRPAPPCWRGRRVPPLSSAAMVGLRPARADDRRHRPVGAGRRRPRRSPPRPPRPRCRFRPALPSGGVSRSRRRSPPAGRRPAGPASARPVDVAMRRSARATSKRSRLRSIRSSVERPTEPVAPRMVTLRAPVTRGQRSRPSSSKVGEQRRGEQAVEPVEHAAMAGQQRAAVLDPGAALHPAFVEIAEPGRAAPSARRARGRARRDSK